MARGQSHGLGFGNGSIIDYGGGIIEYRQTGKMLPAFKVNIADVTGFSARRATKQDKKSGASTLQQMFVLQGSGQNSQLVRLTTERHRRSKRGFERIHRFAETFRRTRQRWHHKVRPQSASRTNLRS